MPDERQAETLNMSWEEVVARWLQLNSEVVHQQRMYRNMLVMLDMGRRKANRHVLAQFRTLVQQQSDQPLLDLSPMLWTPFRRQVLDALQRGNPFYLRLLGLPVVARG